MPRFQLARQRRWCQTASQEPAESSSTSPCIPLAEQYQDNADWVGLPRIIGPLQCSVHHAFFVDFSTHGSVCLHICALSMSASGTGPVCMYAHYRDVHAACPRSVRTALAVAILMVGTLTAAANVWGVKRINHRSLSRVGPQASDLLGREVNML